METFNSQLLLQQIQQYQQIQHPMIEELLVLFQQEAALCYQPADYLAHLTATATFSAETADTGPVVVDVNNDFEIFMGNSVIDGVQRRHEYVTMRQKMGEWAYDVIDYHGMSREVGALAMNYTDRYLQALWDQRRHIPNHDPDDPEDDDQEEVPTGRAYQLIVMTGLYLAIKLSIGSYFGDLLDARTMCAMSRGMFTRDKLLAMERNVLHTLSWRMHPPTAKVFLNHYMELLADNYCQGDKKQLLAVRNEADFMLEHAVLDYHFCSHYPSVIAIAALCNTASVVWYDGNHNNNNSPLSLLKQILVGHGCSWDEGQVVDCRQRLHELMVHYHSHHQATAAGGGQHRLEQSSETADQFRIQSPVSVAEVIDLTTMAVTKKQKTEASMLTIDITSANASATAATATRRPSC